MTTITFAKAFRRHVECPDVELDASPPDASATDATATTLGTILGGYFDRHPAVRTYVLDDEGAIRRHVTVFVDGTQIDHRRGLDAPVGAASTVHVFQALSGG